MRNQKWLFMELKNQQRKSEPHSGTRYDLEFNDDLYALATPAFWQAWRDNGKKVGMYAPARVPASAIGLTSDRLVWIVFVNGDVRRGFLDKLCIDGKMQWGQR